MWRLLMDENIETSLMNGLASKNPNLDIVRAQGVGLRTTPDTTVMDWAGSEGRILISRDVSTIPPLVRRRIAEGKPVPGVILVTANLSIGDAIRSILRIMETEKPEDWEGRVHFLKVPRN
jgi:predicted nuclease of predicted toxin-antitoxin system